MQINFNPHLPPGYFETHELDGMSWKIGENGQRGAARAGRGLGGEEIRTGLQTGDGTSEAKPTPAGRSVRATP